VLRQGRPNAFDYGIAAPLGYIRTSLVFITDASIRL
jgi:hypothetical protein